MSKKLKILVAADDQSGHVNSSIPIARALKNRGHQVIFAIDPSWQGKLAKENFEEVLILDPSKTLDSAQYWTQMLPMLGAILGFSPLQKLHAGRQGLMQLFNKAKTLDPIMKQIIDRERPDLVLVNYGYTIPSLMNSAIPWINICSTNPLMVINDERTPPKMLGNN